MRLLWNAMHDVTNIACIYWCMILVCLPYLSYFRISFEHDTSIASFTTDACGDHYVSRENDVVIFRSRPFTGSHSCKIVFDLIRTLDAAAEIRGRSADTDPVTIPVPPSNLTNNRVFRSCLSA